MYFNLIVKPIKAETLAGLRENCVKEKSKVQEGKELDPLLLTETLGEDVKDLGKPLGSQETASQEMGSESHKYARNQNCPTT